MADKIAYGQKSVDAVIEARLTEEPSVSALVADMRKDPYVCLVERDIRATVATAQVSVSTTSRDQRAVALAETLNDLWFNHIGQMLECFAYGRVAFEAVWTYVKGLNLNTVLKLEPLPHNDTEPYFGKEKEKSTTPQGVILKLGEDPVTLDAPYGWWLALDATALNPYGVSRFSGAMQEVWEKRCDVGRKLKTFIRKYALGDTTVYADPVRKGPGGQDIDQWSEIAESFDDTEGGDLRIFPNDYVQDAAGTMHRKIEVDRTEVGVRDGAPLMNLAKELGAEVLLAAAIPPRTVLESDSGSFALVTWQMLVKYAVVEDILSQIGQQFQTAIVGPAMAYNGVDGVVWNFVPLTQRPDDLMTELAKGLISQPSLSPLVASGQVDIKKILEMAGIPVAAGNAPLSLPPPPVAQMAAPLGQSSFRLWR